MKPKVDILSIPEGKDMLKNYAKTCKKKGTTVLKNTEDTLDELQKGIEKLLKGEANNG